MGDALRERLLIRGAALPDTVTLDTSPTVELTAAETSQFELVLVDENLTMARAGLFPVGTTVDLDDLRFQIAATIPGPGSTGAGGLTLTCRAAAVRKLDSTAGALRMTAVSAATYVEQRAAAAEVPAVVQPSPTLPEVARDTDQPGDSDWTTFTRLAGELGYVVFEAAGTVYFGQPTWLTSQAAAAALVVRWFNTDGTLLAGDHPDRPLAMPEVRESDDDPNHATVTVTIHPERARTVRPGQVLRLAGFVARYERDYLIDSVSYNADLTGVATVVASIPKDPTPQTAAGGTGAGGDVDEPSAKAVSEIPPAYLAAYRAAPPKWCPGLPWQILAAVGWVETRHRAGLTSSAGARGPMQFLPGTWAAYGVDGDGDGRADIDNPADAVPAAARYLHTVGAPGDIPRALASYNAGPGNWHAGRGYAADVLTKTREYLPPGASVAEDGTVVGPAFYDTPGTGTGSGGGGSQASQFVDMLLSQLGNTSYRFGAEADQDDPDPDELDCSEAIEWAAARVGVYIPDGSSNQIAYCQTKGTIISVEQAVGIRGALLWKQGHIGVSLGNGMTFEAASRRTGVVSRGANVVRWTKGATVPGMSYG